MDSLTRMNPFAGSLVVLVGNTPASSFEQEEEEKARLFLDCVRLLYAEAVRTPRGFRAFVVQVYLLAEELGFGDTFEALLPGIVATLWSREPEPQVAAYIAQSFVPRRLERAVYKEVLQLLWDGYDEPLRVTGKALLREWPDCPMLRQRYSKNEQGFYLSTLHALGWQTTAIEREITHLRLRAAICLAFGDLIPKGKRYVADAHLLIQEGGQRFRDRVHILWERNGIGEGHVRSYFEGIAISTHFEPAVLAAVWP